MFLSPEPLYQFFICIYIMLLNFTITLPTLWFLSLFTVGLLEDKWNNISNNQDAQDINMLVIISRSC